MGGLTISHQKNKINIKITKAWYALNRMNHYFKFNLSAILNRNLLRVTVDSVKYTLLEIKVL